MSGPAMYPNSLRKNGFDFGINMLVPKNRTVF